MAMLFNDVDAEDVASRTERHRRALVQQALRARKRWKNKQREAEEARVLLTQAVKRMDERGRFEYTERVKPIIYAETGLNVCLDGK